MSQNDDLELILKVVADNSVDIAAKKVDKIAVSYDHVTDAAKQAGKVGTSSLLDVEDAATITTSALLDAEEAARKLNNELDKKPKGSGGSGANPLDSAGRFASGSAQVGGALEQFGLQGAGNIGQIGAAIGDAAENLPKLAEAAKELPSAVGSALSALGPAGIVVAAVAAGIAALVLVSQKGAEEMKKAAAARLAAEEEVAAAIAGGLTTEAAQERLKELERVLESQTDLVKKAEDERTAAFEQAVQDAQGLDIAGRIREAFGLTDSAELDAALERRKTAEAETKAEIEQLTAALGDNELAANDAAEAEAELAAERTSNILAEAQAAGELATLQERVTDLTQEQIDSELKALSLRETGLKAEIAALEASGDTSAEVTKKLADLRGALGALGSQASVLRGARGGARSEAAEKAAEEAAREQERAAQAARQAAEREQEQARSAREQARKERQNAQEEALKQEQQFQDSLAKLQQDVADKRIDQEIDNARALQDIVTSFGDQRADALEEQNFLALASLNKEERRAKRDQATANERANEDITREGERANRDLLQQQQQYHQQRNTIERQGFQASLNNVRGFTMAANQLTAQMAAQIQRRLDSQRLGTADARFRENSSRSLIATAPRGI